MLIVLIPQDQQHLIPLQHHQQMQLLMLDLMKFLAALVVLTFALVATFIPRKPAKAEQIAPTIKETETIPLASLQNL